MDLFLAITMHVLTFPTTPVKKITTYTTEIGSSSSGGYRSSSLMDALVTTLELLFIVYRIRFQTITPTTTSATEDRQRISGVIVVTAMRDSQDWELFLGWCCQWTSTPHSLGSSGGRKEGRKDTRNWNISLFGQTSCFNSFKVQISATTTKSSFRILLWATFFWYYLGGKH